jgi:hypothetical protein
MWISHTQIEVAGASLFSKHGENVIVNVRLEDCCSEPTSMAIWSTASLSSVLGGINSFPVNVGASRSYTVTDPQCTPPTRSHRPPGMIYVPPVPSCFIQRRRVNFTSLRFHPMSALRLTRTQRSKSWAEYDSSGSSRRGGCIRSAAYWWNWLVQTIRVLDIAARCLHVCRSNSFSANIKGKRDSTPAVSSTTSTNRAPSLSPQVFRAVSL